VRGTVRDPNNEKKVKPIKDAFGESFKDLSLVYADLLDEDSVSEAIKGATYVAHVASPFTIDVPKDEMDLIRPAVEGTLSVLRACRRHKVKRVCITSSIASISHTSPGNEPKDNTFTEENWSELDGPNKIAPYQKSKTLAEKAAWDYVASLPDDEKFELSVINPGQIAGPSFIGGDFSSGKVISDMMGNKFPAIPKVNFPVVDVRDVARAHVNALQSD